MILWQVMDHEEAYHCDVIGAESALAAARKYVAARKIGQLEEIEVSRKLYEDLVLKGEIDPTRMPFCSAGFMHKVVLPGSVVCVPMFDIGSFHEMCIDNDRKYQAQAFLNMWDWSKRETVRL